MSAYSKIYLDEVKENQGSLMQIVCFHNPDEENGYLSNWCLSSFIVKDRSFSSMEEIASRIMKTDDVSEIKQLGRLVSGYDDNVWNGIRQIVVYEGLLAKFLQNETLKKQLKATGNAVLAECAVKDKIWGIGVSMQDPARFDKAKWKGQNLLGYALMMVREKL